MKLKVSVVLPDGELHDITLACDVTATVADTARALIRAGTTGNARIEQIAASRFAPVTLQAASGSSGAAMLLDPATPIGDSGLQSGWAIEPVLEFGQPRAAARLVPAAAFVSVRSGPQRGVEFSLLRGSNTIGRDRGCRVHLHHKSVSRRHVEVNIDEQGVLLTDLGSANGIVAAGERHERLRISRPSTVRLGDIDLLITPGVTFEAAPRLDHRILHTRAPRVAPHFSASQHELPSPPAPAEPGRVPMLAMLAPMLMGGALYAITRSPLSLMMVAFSPIMMIGSWLDGKLGARRKLKKELTRFEGALRADRELLSEQLAREIRVRGTETPTLDEITRAIEHRDELLWARRPEHRSFLEVRLGAGALPSRTAVVLPKRGDAGPEQWQLLQRTARAHETADPVPVIERFERCGSIGVAGDRAWADGFASSLVLQLLGLHSPAELTIACFAGEQHEAAWSWLKWVPHVDPVSSPIPNWQIADSQQSSLRLLGALEGVVEQRAHRGRSTIRSHLDPGSRNDEGQGEAVTELPTLPVIVVLVLETWFVDPARLIELAERGPDVGVHIVWVTTHRAEIPAACRTFVEVDAAGGAAHFARSGSIVSLSHVEFVDAPLAHHLARRLAPVEDIAARVLDESDLPNAVSLRELHPVDLLSGAGPIVQAWASTGSLTAAWQGERDRSPISLAAIVGQGAEGPAQLDLRTHGPHALVGGTTGSGKSEFLQSWIMSMAASVSPDRLSFLLVDYKGGAAFAECVELPHTVGLVTDLSPHLVRRALTSLRAELRHREELLAEHGAKDLIAMERRSDPAAPPLLVIVIDEFAALAAEVPEFVDGVIDIAQRGRSLGLHLIMATQRPAGVIKDNLRANTNLRVALRMADEADSSDVIGVKDAAFFDAETPGRGAIKAGPGRITHFQTGHLGGRESATGRAADIQVHSLDLAEGEAWEIPPEELPAPKRRSDARDIERLRDGIVAAASVAAIRPPRRPWLDELPAVIDLAGLAGEPHRPELPVIGLCDDPEAQAQHTISVDLDEVGNLGIVGASGTGKTSALIALTAALCRDPKRVRVYGIDAAGGALGTVSSLPTVGAVAALADAELTGRVLRRVLEVIAERGPRFASERAGDLAAYRRTAGHGDEPRVVLLIDGFGAFRQATEGLGGEQPFRMLAEIMMRGRAVGVHVVVTSDRPGAIPASMQSSLQRQFVLRLANPADYGAYGIKADALEEAPAGRAVIAGDGRDVQLALVGGEQSLAGQAAAIESLAAQLRAAGVEQVPRVVNTPEVVPLCELPASVAGLPVYGIDTRSFEPVALPFAGLGVIAGPSGSGVSTAMLACVRACERRALEAGESVEKVLLSFSGSALRHEVGWSAVASGAGEVEGAAKRLVDALSGKSSPEAPAFPSSGSHGIIVVERPADAESTEAMPQLVGLAKAARRSDVLVLFEFEPTSVGGIWELCQALKQPSWGLSLQPDQHESQSPFREDLGRVSRRDFPPGRGCAVERGRVTPVHVALSADPG